MRVKFLCVRYNSSDPDLCLLCPSVLQTTTCPQELYSCWLKEPSPSMPPPPHGLFFLLFKVFAHSTAFVRNSLQGSHSHGTGPRVWAFCFLLQPWDVLASLKPQPLAGSSAHKNFSRKVCWMTEWMVNKGIPLLEAQSGVFSPSYF